MENYFEEISKAVGYCSLDVFPLKVHVMESWAPGWCYWQVMEPFKEVCYNGGRLWIIKSVVLWFSPITFGFIS